MKGLVYKGPRKVAVENVPDAAIETPLDAVIRALYVEAEAAETES